MRPRGRRAVAAAAAVLASEPAQRVRAFAGNQLDTLTGAATAPLETAAWLDSFLPSLMPRTSMHQGLASGLNVLTARVVGTRLESLVDAVVAPGGPVVLRLGIRGAQVGIGQWLANLPETDDETLWRSGVRTGGRWLRVAGACGAIYDVSLALRGSSRRGRSGPLLVGVAITGGAVVWAGFRLQRRKEVIQRWPVPQDAKMVAAIGTGAVLVTVGTGLGKAYGLTGRALRSYLGPELGKGLLAVVANTGAWALAATAAYQAGIGSLGKANEKIEPAYSRKPTSDLVSGSPDSLLPFSELGQQGRRFVTDVITPEQIEAVVGEPAVAHPIRAYVGFNTAPLYTTGRAELALAELERTGAFDRSYLLLVSPTGTGWVDQTVVEAAEFLTRGDIATCSVQYGRFPSFLCVQKVGLGRMQFRILLWGIRARLAERPPEERPKVLVFGESLGAWTASDVLMSGGITGFDHYGIDRALWFGLPALAKWSRNGMASGSHRLVPEGTVQVFDHHDELAALSDEERDRLRAVILSHDNDPIAALRPELMIREPDWLRGERGRNVPADMEWTPLTTFWQVAIDAANAMVTVPGQFNSFGHDYRGDTTRFVRDGLHLPPTSEEQTERIEEALKAIDVARKERLAAQADEEPIEPAPLLSADSFAGGVPLEVAQASGAQWLRRRSKVRTAAAEAG